MKLLSILFFLSAASYSSRVILVCEGFSISSSSSQKTISNLSAPRCYHHEKIFSDSGMSRSVMYATANRREIIGSIIYGSSMLLKSGAYAATTTTIEVMDDNSNSNKVNNNDGSFESFISSTTTQKLQQQQQQQQSQKEVNDEVTVEVKKSDLLKTAGLGIELGEVEFRTNRRVVIKSVEPNSLGSQLGIKKDWVIVRVNGQTAERTNTEGVAIMVSRAVRDNNNSDDTITLTFRDPYVFRQQLQSLDESKSVTTQVAPMGDTTQRNERDGSVKMGYDVTEQSDQKFTVTQLVSPKLCTRGATVDDLLEISYLGTVVETGQVFDGSSVKINGQAIPGRADDVSLYFVLGKQPFGQFPPGWDVGLEGMCVGERRRLIIPPVLAYGSKGLPRRNIPPNATLQYDITLLSVNGLATPQ